MLRNRGAVAFVTDGTVRDLPGLRDARLPCFATGITPNSPVRNGPGTVNLPIAIGGVVVGPGDILIGDQDGVVVLPFDRIDAVIARLVEIRAAEKELSPRSKAGSACRRGSKSFTGAARSERFEAAAAGMTALNRKPPACD